MTHVVDRLSDLVEDEVAHDDVAAAEGVVEVDGRAVVVVDFCCCCCLLLLLFLLID